MSNHSIGSLVRFREREWVVQAIEQDLLYLRPLTGGLDDVCGAYLPLEEQNIKPASFPPPSADDLGDFESARLLKNAARLLIRNGAGPFRSFANLSFRPRPYQLVPLLMSLRITPVRLLVADDVGIGKTIEAGLIARELLDRGEIRRMAVVCPPYLCDQWQKELLQKFSIDAKIVRTNTLARLERDLPRRDLCVFDYYPNIIVSVDFVKGQRRRDAFLLHCPDFVIIDEAHGCARPAGQSVTQQQRHQLIHDLASAEERRHLVLVTATPHSGIEESFLSLLGFLNPSFLHLNLDSPSEEELSGLVKHFVQRRRKDVEKWMGEVTAFPERIAEDQGFVLSEEYHKLFRDIYRFCRETVSSVDTESGHKIRVRYWAALALLRCVMSSPAAAKAALRARIENLPDEPSEAEEDFSVYIFDPTDLETSVDVAPTRVVNEGELSFSEKERRKLREFEKRAEALKGSSDTKIGKAEEIAKSLLKGGYNPIVFCRFIATADYVAEDLKKGWPPSFRIF